MRILALSGVDVIGIGPQDLTLGKDKLTNLIERSPIDMVSANLPGFLPYVRLRKDGGNLKVLITSVIDPEVMKKYKIEYAGEIGDPISALKQLQKKIDHDLFIVIVHAMGERITTIKNGCPGIDLVVDGLTAAVSDNLDREGVIPIICNNRRGQYVNYVEYRHGAAKKLKKPVLLRAGVGIVPEDPEIKSIAEAYNKEKIAYSKQARQKRMQERLQLDMERHPPNLYLGNRACESCHQETAEEWAESRHARALASLQKRGREDDFECLKCHVTGMGEKHAIGGFSSIEETPWMVNVQCESCHGAGANHAQRPLDNKMKLVGEKGCLRCHTEVSDPDFDFKNKFLLIEHSEKR